MSGAVPPDELGAHPSAVTADGDHDLLDVHVGIFDFVTTDGLGEGFTHAGVHEPMADADHGAIVPGGGARGAQDVETGENKAQHK